MQITDKEITDRATRVLFAWSQKLHNPPTRQAFDVRDLRELIDAVSVAFKGFIKEEREGCAQVADRVRGEGTWEAHDPWCLAAERIALLIRDRGGPRAELIVT